MIEADPVDAPKRFVVVDDHSLFREALIGALRASFAGAVIQEADSIEAARAALLGWRDVDLLLLDLSLKRFDGFDGLVRLRKEFPFVPVLIVSGMDEPRVVHESLCLGAAGFVSKAAGRAVLADAISTVMSGRIYVPKTMPSQRESAAPRATEKRVADGVARLTPAQARVLKLLRRGLLNREIAAELGIGESTVKAHVSDIIRKLGVISRTQIVIETARNDLAAGKIASEAG